MLRHRDLVEDAVKQNFIHVATSRQRADTFFPFLAYFSRTINSTLVIRIRVGTLRQRTLYSRFSHLLVLEQFRVRFWLFLRFVEDIFEGSTS